MNINIRRAVLSDAQTIKNIDSIVPVNASRSNLIDFWLKQDVVLIAEADNQPIGYGVFNHSFFRQSQIEMIMIIKEFRGKRIGEMLLGSLEKFADTDKIFVTTNLTNYNMQKLLLRNNYKPCGYIDGLDPGDPELIYIKNLKS